MNNVKDYWLTDESWKVVQIDIDEDMAIIEEYYRGAHRENPELYDKWIIAYWQRISYAYWVEEAKNKFLAWIRKIFDVSK